MFSSLILRDICGLTAEQSRTGITIGAELRWISRQWQLAYRDWEMACSQVVTEKNPRPTDDQIRPVAEMVYRERLRRQAETDWEDAKQLLVSQGILSPVDEQIRPVAHGIYLKREEKLAIGDWLAEEKSANEHGSVLLPV